MSDSYQDNSQSGGSTITYLKLDQGCAPHFLEKEFIFGEEYEFALDGASESDFSTLAEKWIEMSSLKAAQVELDIQFKREITEINCSSYLTSCTITLGKEFKLKIFRDYDSLEVNTSPYSCYQNFTTIFHISKSEPATGTTNKEYPQIAENISEKEKKARFIAELKVRLYSKRLFSWYGKAIKFLNEMPCNLIDECSNFVLLCRGKITDRIFWKLISKQMAVDPLDDSIYDCPKNSEAVVANIIVNTLEEKGYSILHIFKFSQSITPK